MAESKNMKLSLGVPVMNLHKETIEFVKKIYKTSSILERIYIVDNGSKPEMVSKLFQEGIDKEFLNKIHFIRNEKNIGVRPALNQIWAMAKEDIIVYTHNDVEFLEKGWDLKVIKAFEKHPEAGIIGAYGAKGIGTADIYKTPYKMEQLARGGNVSDCPMDKTVHGFRNLENEFENVAVFDGFFMAIKKELLNKTNGFSDILPEHHNMDNLICIQSLENGYENILIPLGLFHRGGMTDVGQDWASVFGKTKQQVHKDSHPPLYEYCKGKLPIWIEDIFDDKAKICGYNLYMDNKLVKTKLYE